MLEIELTENVLTHAAKKPKTTKKAPGRARVANIAPKKGKSGKKAASAKEAPKRTTKAEGGKSKGVLEGSKTETILELLKQPGGATAKELLKATGWQAHSLRGFLSGTVGKKMGLAVTSTKGGDGERSYSVKA